jgi:putative membrane protein
MHRFLGAAAFVVAITLAAPGLAATHGKHHAANAHKGQAMSDTQFMREAAIGGMAEVDLGKIGVQRAENPDVKQFAQRMVDDHSKANDQLKQVAEKRGVALPGDVDAKHKAAIDRLSKLSGPAFDKAYMRDMVTDHNHDVSLFERQSASGKDDELKSWVDQTLPTLKEHQDMAKDVAAKVGAEPGTRVHGTAPRPGRNAPEVSEAR